jgi:cytochrome c oxidase assembly protein subunit 15
MATGSAPLHHRMAIFTVLATIILITAGGLVTSTGSGLAVPDWPLSYGMVFPPMVGGILYEHGHRMIAATVGLLTMILALWLWRREARAWVKRLGLLAVAAVVIQGVLGGITVLLLLPAPVSVAHACIAQAFLLLLVTLAVVTSRSWIAAGTASRGSRPAVAGLHSLTIATTTAIYLQLILGALVRHTGSGLAIPDFPLAFGRLIPPLASSQVAIQFIHRLGAVVVTLLVLWTAARVLRRLPAVRVLSVPAALLIPLLAAQILFGALTVLSRLAVVPATAHVSGGALLLAASMILTLMTHRLVSRPIAHAADTAPMARPVTS